MSAQPRAPRHPSARARRSRAPVSVTDATQKVRKPIRFASTDLSSGGAFLRADVLFEVGEVLLVEFRLPRRAHTRSRPRGASCAFAAAGQKDGSPGMGIEFVDLLRRNCAAIDTA